MSDWQEAGNDEYLKVALAAAAVTSFEGESGAAWSEHEVRKQPTPWQTVGPWEIAST